MSTFQAVQKGCFLEVYQGPFEVRSQQTSLWTPLLGGFLCTFSKLPKESFVCLGAWKVIPSWFTSAKERPPTRLASRLWRSRSRYDIPKPPRTSAPDNLDLSGSWSWSGHRYSECTKHHLAGAWDALLSRFYSFFFVFFPRIFGCFLGAV